MENLSEHFLEVGGLRLAASAPEPGDARAEPPEGTPLDRQRVTIGVAAADVARLAGLEGQPGRLLGLEGHELLRFQVDEIDPASAVLLGLRVPQP